MASTADNPVTDAKAEAAVEKAYAEAAQAKPVAAKVEAPKIDKALAEVKSAPKKKAVAKKVPAKKAAAKKTQAPRRAAKAQPVAAQIASKKSFAAPKRAIPTITQLKDKIIANTKTTDFAASVKTAAADAQTRAKAAYDKFQGFAGEVNEFTKGNVEALVESGKILGAGVQDIARGEFEAAKGAFETATADLKAMAAVKSPTELFKLQGEIARRNFDAAVARASKNAEVSVKLANDAFEPISSRMSLAAERLSNAA